MIEKKHYIPQILLLGGAAVLALFFDAQYLVWVLGGLAVFVAAAYEYLRRAGIAAAFFGVPLAILTLAAWEWFAVLYGARSLQVIPAWSVAIFVVLLAAACAYLLPTITSLGRFVCGVLTALWALVLLFATTSFFALGAGAAAVYALSATIVHHIETAAPRKRIITTALVGLATIILAALLFPWFL